MSPPLGDVQRGLASCQIILFCVLLWIPTDILATLTFNPFRTNPVNIKETETLEMFLAKVDCTATPPEVCMCTLGSGNNGDPFNVWKGRNGYADFEVYYVGAASGSALSYKRKPTYNLDVKCEDSTGSNDTHTLRVDVTPNRPPLFTGNAANRSVTVPAPDGHLVYIVKATDDDGDPLSYKITSTTPTVNYFRIDSRTGKISVSTTNNLYTATESKVVVKVEVSDGYTPVDNFHLTVHLQDLNHRPDIVELPTVLHLLENSRIGTPVITLTINDSGLLIPKTAPLCTVLPANERFKFKFVWNGQNIYTISLASSLDYETTSSYTISCTVTDGYLNSQNEVLTLYVDNVNEPPVFDDIAYYCVLQESDAGISSCDLGPHDILSDPEGDAISSVGFVSGNNSNRFRYIRSANRVTFNVDYDVDVGMLPTSVVLQLQATDVYGDFSRVPVYLTVTDANDNTCYFTQSPVQLPPIHQATQIGIVGNVVARDDDLTSPNNRVTYELVMGLPPDAINYLSFYSDGTVVYAAEIPDSSSPKVYSLIVRCKDGGTPRRSSETTVVLRYSPTTSTSTTTTTTTSTTTTTTTTPSTTTPTTTTTTEASDVWDDSAFVGTFAALMCLLGIGLSVALWLCARYYLLGKSMASLGGSGLRDFCCPKPQPNKTEPVDDYINYTVSTNPDYHDDYWRQGDKFETGKEEAPTNPLAGGLVRVHKSTPPQAFDL